MHETGSPDNWFDSSMPARPYPMADEHEEDFEGDTHAAEGWVGSRFDEPMPAPRTRPLFSGQLSSMRLPSMRVSDLSRQSALAIAVCAVSGLAAVAVGYYCSGALVPLFESPTAQAPRGSEPREDAATRARSAEPVTAELGARRAPRKQVVLTNKSGRTLASKAFQSPRAFEPNTTPDMDLMNIPSSPMEQRALAERGLAPVSTGQENNADGLNKLGLMRDPGAETGTVHINSRPWAHVFIDGRSVGTTPLLKLPVTVGQHRVLLVNNIFNMSKTLDVEVAADEHVTRVVSLDGQ